VEKLELPRGGALTRHRPIPLLPYEKQLADALGVDEATYQSFKAEVASRVRIDPAQPTAGIAPLTFALNLVIGVGFSLVSALFKPKAPGKPPTLINRSISGATISENQRKAPRFGFGAVQEPARAGDSYSLVIARREVVRGRTYGGVRVDLPLLWSQMWSVNGSQVLRAIFLLGRRNMGVPHVNGFAFGDNSLVAYDLGYSTQRGARYALYASINGGRIVADDWIGGRHPSTDIGNAQGFGGSDVFGYRGIDGAIQKDFCCVAKPSSGTAMGLYGFIPNGMAYRVAPRLRPTATYQINTRNNGSNYYIEGEDDTSALADFWKSKYQWSCRSGLRSYKRDGDTTTPAQSNGYAIVNVRVDDLLTFTMSGSSDVRTKIRMYTLNTDADDNSSETILDCTDVGSGVASWQHDAEESMMQGELYKIGSALAILESQNPNGRFLSDADKEPAGGGINKDFRFRVVRAGLAGFVGTRVREPSSTGKIITPPYYSRDNDMAQQASGTQFQSATSFPQIMRCAVASWGTTRPTRLIEVGFKVTMSIRVSGFTNLRDCPKLQTVNARAGQNRTGSVDDDTKINASQFQSGTVTSSETRYAFYQLHWRAGPNDGWTYFPDAVFGFGSSTGEPSYHYIRIQMPSESASWQWRMEPLSGWQIRSGAGWGGDLIVLDSFAPVGSRTDSLRGVRVSYNGFQIGESNPGQDFKLSTIDARVDIGYGWTEGNSMIDAWGRLAEKFCYDEISTTATGGPEVEISYVNIFTTNAQQADYDDLALIGGNFMAGTELTQLAQATQDVENGYLMPRLLDNTYGPTHLWPDLLRELMVNQELGDGSFITAAQIDTQSFRDSAQWCYDRGYFFDGVISRPLNLLSWGSEVGTTHLLQLVKRGTLFGLKPALTFGAPLPISGLFTAGNIVENTFELNLVPYDERQPIQMLGKFREQNPRLGSYAPGWFPQERTILLREKSQPITAPLEELDLSDYCTSEQHLIDGMAFIIRRRRLVDHTISFATTPEGLTAGLASGDYIQVAYDLIYFDRYAHGVVTNSGQLVTTRPDLMAAGSHLCLTWDGSSADPTERQVVVATDGTATPTGIMFARKDVSQDLRTYEITKLSMERDGKINIEATCHPCDANGYSLLTQNWPTDVSDAYWEVLR